MKKALAIDMGATSIRGIIGYIEDGKIKLEEVMRFSHEIKSSNGRLRWDFDELLKKIVETIKENGHEISSVGIDTWGVDFGLVDKEGKLYATKAANQNNPFMEEGQHTPILGIDVWEHAYYLRYKNLRGDYLKNFFEVLDWEKVSENYERGR